LYRGSKTLENHGELGEEYMREIVHETTGTNSVTYKFNDGSVVWVCFKPATAVDANAYTMARMTAQRFLNTLNPAGRWEGKIDGAGNILESPIELG
jgi:hypothetical protein